MNRQHFTSPFSPTSLPAWRCPHCLDGALTQVKDSLKLYETAASMKNRDDPDWDPEWISKRFFLSLSCVKCSEPVLCVGDVQSNLHHGDELGWAVSDLLVPSYFEPAIPLVLIPKLCPESVHAEILNAFALYWTSPSSSGNKVRAALERLMDELGVPAARNLHTRIEGYAKTNAEVGEKLLAIKWIGNTGSHSDKLETNDVLDALELLEYSLEAQYEGKSLRLTALAKTIITHKGPPPK